MGKSYRVRETPPPSIFDAPQFFGGIWGFVLHSDRTLRRSTRDRAIEAVVRCVGQRDQFNRSWQFEIRLADDSDAKGDGENVHLETALRRAEEWLIAYNERAAPGQEP